jgi:cytochrome c553
MAGALLVLAAVAGLVAAAGVVPLRASDGHWAATRWVLKFAMRRSVATQSLGLRAPPLDDHGLVTKGATHYEGGCRPCHGSPDHPQPVIAARMTPHPPPLSGAAARWEPGELFYIVKHGVKFTGMPAWPAPGRDDEAWALVAFLHALPALTAEEYRRLARPGPPRQPAEGAAEDSNGVPRVVRENCARCHGLDGGSRGMTALPVLAGQQPAYLLASLVAFQRSARQSGIMQPAVASLGSDLMREAARYYADLPGPTRPREAPAPAVAERGRDIALRGIPVQRVPPCIACHGPGDVPRNAIYPHLAGQHADYLALQLLLFRSAARGGTAYEHVMRAVATRLRPEQIREVAAYYASLPGPGANPGRPALAERGSGRPAGLDFDGGRE